MAGQLSGVEWKPLNDIPNMESVINAFESTFQSGSEYSLLDFSTNVGAEAGAIMFKHSASTPSYGILFSRNTGVVVIFRSTTGAWSYKNIMIN